MYNMAFNKTLHKIGQKTITVAAQKQEKYRISCILSINAEGNILKPYIIFKEAQKGKIYKSLINTDEVVSKKCVGYTNSNAWSTNNIVKDWMDNVYCSYFVNILLEKTLLNLFFNLSM